MIAQRKADAQSLWADRVLDSTALLVVGHRASYLGWLPPCLLVLPALPGDTEYPTLQKTPSASPQGPFPLAHLRAWHRAGHFPPAMPVVHVGAPGLPVQLAELFARALPVRLAASDVRAAAGGNSTPAGGVSDGLQPHATRASGNDKQLANGHMDQATTSRAPTAAPVLGQEAVTNCDADDFAPVAAEVTPATRDDRDHAANALGSPSSPKVAEQVKDGPNQLQDGTSPGVAAVEGVGPQHPQPNGLPGEARVETKPCEPHAGRQRTASSEKAPENVPIEGPELAADVVPAPVAAASQSRKPADAVPDLGVSAVSAAASRPQLRSVERMAVGKSKYSITVRAKVACRLFADARGEANCDAVVIAPDGTEYPVKLAYSKVCAHAAPKACARGALLATAKD